MASDRDEQTERYRTAAEETLEQLEWCVGYLYRLRKPEIARSIDRNRRSIQHRLREDFKRSRS